MQPLFQCPSLAAACPCVQGFFPQLFKDCPAYMRHKEMLLSPSLLRSHGISFMQVGQWTTILATHTYKSHPHTFVAHTSVG